MTIEDVVGQLPGVVEVKGPAALFFAVESPVPARHVEVVQASVDELDGLLASVPFDELDESGMSEVTSSVSVIRDSDGEVVAACGYQHWPHGIAHMCVLTQPEHRGRGAAHAVGAAAVKHALGRRQVDPGQLEPPHCDPPNE
jgi:GNAT superfamily N-acetyltransferase